MLSGVRTRNGSLSFVLAFATEEAPRLIVTSIDAIRNAEIFLNILPPQKPSEISSPVVCFNFLCLGRFLDASVSIMVGSYRTASGSDRPFAGADSLNKQRPVATARGSVTYLCSWHTPLVSQGGGTPKSAY